jgi:hypothetical protein
VTGDDGGTRTGGSEVTAAVSSVQRGMDRRKRGERAAGTDLEAGTARPGLAVLLIVVLELAWIALLVLVVWLLLS